MFNSRSNYDILYSLSIDRTDQRKQKLFLGGPCLCPFLTCHEPANLGLTISACYNNSEMIG